MSRFYRTWYFILAWIFRLVMRVKVINKEKQPKRGDGPYIICANHISASDPIAIAVSLRYIQPHYLAKEQLFKNKIAGWFFRNIGMIPLTRTGNDVGALKTTINILKDGKSVGIFPQGTRHAGEEPRDTKVRTGVGMIQAYSGADVLPIYIKTKDNRFKFLRRIYVIIGDVITAEEIGKEGRGSAEYQRVSELIFDRICTLGEDFDRKRAEKKKK